MSDTLVIAISQSGTTTDTNRTVDLVRARGATVVAIVNRRNSDLVDKSDGVLYTSDGRDVEMSVASTKAFYAQIAAGFLLAVALARGGRHPRRGVGRRGARARCASCPDAMAAVVARRPEIAAVAQRQALTRRYWAVVGNGSNSIAAHELRIKLSELCYKAIACDVTEDKKHIDLSSEPLILVCAAGLVGRNRRRRRQGDRDLPGAPRGTDRHRVGGCGRPLRRRARDITVPDVHPDLGFVLATVVGHLFGYEAALAIDALGPPAARGACRDRVGGGAANRRRSLDWLAPVGAGAGAPVLGRAASTATTTARSRPAPRSRLTSLFRYATGAVPLDVYELEHGKVGTPERGRRGPRRRRSPSAIDELTRPVDAIKHQAKTVTVGHLALRRDAAARSARARGARCRASRATASPTGPCARSSTSTSPSWRSPATRGTGSRATSRSTASTVHIVDRGGVAVDIASRTETDPTLRGTKHRVATTREVTAVRGARDGRTLVIVPEVKHNQTVGPRAAARPLRRSVSRPTRCGRCCRATRAVTRR